VHPGSQASHWGRRIQGSGVPRHRPGAGRTRGGTPGRRPGRRGPLTAPSAGPGKAGHPTVGRAGKGRSQHRRPGRRRPVTPSLAGHARAGHRTEPEKVAYRTVGPPAIRLRARAAA